MCVRVKEWIEVPRVKAVLDNFLAIFPPFVTIIKDIYITPWLETESWLS